MFEFLFLINLILINSIKFEHLLQKSENKLNRYQNEELIEIANYEKLNNSDSNYIYIPIFGTSDLHGHFYPNKFESESLNYSQGGLDYMSKYINIIRNEFDGKMLYLDAGDLFSGGVESSITNSSIMINYFNSIKLDGLTVGNHEFDFDLSFMEEKVNESNFPFIVANVYDNVKKTSKIYGDKQAISEIYNFKYNINNKEVEIKIGVVGFTRILGKKDISGKGYENIVFKEYKKILEEEARYLKYNEKVNAVVLLSHIGFSCADGLDVNMTLNMYKPSDKQEECSKDSELTILLNNIEEGLIDAVVTGHSHFEVHHWIGDIPIISPLAYGASANIIYLAFDKNNNYKIVPSENRIEGPLPICDKIFEKNHMCENIKDSEIKDYMPIIEYKFHGVKIEKDESLKNIHDKYDSIYNEYNEIICKIEGTKELLQRYSNGSFYLGNLITDIGRKYTGSKISIMSYRGLRTDWNPGNIQKYKVYDLLPFKNTLCSMIMTGLEIKKTFKILQSGDKRFYLTSGVKQLVIKTDNGDFLSDIKLFDGYEEKDIYDEQEYLISANSFLTNGGDEFSQVLKFYKPKQVRCDYGYESDLVYNYLKGEKVINVNNYMDENNPSIRFIDKTTKIKRKNFLYK